MEELHSVKVLTSLIPTPCIGDSDTIEEGSSNGQRTVCIKRHLWSTKERITLEEQRRFQRLAELLTKQNSAPAA